MSGVNSQITDSVRQVNDLTITAGADASMTATFLSAANSIGVVMANAAVAEQGMQQIAQSATAVTCSLIVAKAFS